MYQLLLFFFLIGFIFQIRNVHPIQDWIRLPANILY